MVDGLTCLVAVAILNQGLPPPAVSTMQQLATPDELLAVTDLASACTWAGLSGAAWAGLNEHLGTLPSLRVLTAVPADAWRTALRTARVTTTPASGEGDDYVPPVLRPFTVVEVAQAGLLWRVARQKFGLRDEDPLVPPGAVEAPDSPAAARPVATVPDGVRKVKVSEVLDQGDDGVIPKLEQCEVDEFYHQLEKVKGGSVRPEVEPTPDQISAMKVRVVDLRLAPYADFALFVNYQSRFAKSLKFTNHILQPDGSFRSMEVPGPPNFDAWLSSWNVFENTLLMLTVPIGTPPERKAIVTQAALDLYRDCFRDLVGQCPQVWHLLATAEDRCRAEHFPRLKRRLEEDHRQGLEPRFDPTTPWDRVFRVAASERDYWDKHVRDPALRFLATRSKVKEQVGGTGSLTDIARDGVAPAPKRRSRRQRRRENRRNVPAKANETNASGGERKTDAGKGGGRGPKRDVQGRYVTDRDGNPICFAFSAGKCQSPCPKNMSHVCQKCLGSHPTQACKVAN